METGLSGGFSLNARVMALAGEAATESVALNTSGLYVGIAIAGAVGGAALGAYDGIGVLIAATAIGLVTILVMAMSVRLQPSGQTAPAPEGVGASCSHPCGATGSVLHQDLGDTSLKTSATGPGRMMLGYVEGAAGADSFVRGSSDAG